MSERDKKAEEYIQKEFYGKHDGNIGPGHAYKAGWNARQEEIDELNEKIKIAVRALDPYRKAYEENDLTMDWSNVGKDLAEALAKINRGKS